MQRLPALTCPRCTSDIRLAPIGFPPMDETSGEANGTILKKCPRCRTWSWMTLQAQAAS